MASGVKLEMTKGPLFRKLLLFGLPLVASGVLQLLFNAADMIVVGRFSENGEQSLAAVGSTSSLINLVINMFIGLTAGAGAVIARYYGAHNDRSVRNAVHSSVLIALAGGAVLACFGFFAARPLLQLMGSPEDVIDKATLYLKIYFLGMPFFMFYNFGAAVLRAVGDTKRPLYFLTAAGVVNVVLNLILVIGFRMDVAGVAIATVASQAISAVLVLLCLLKNDDCIRLDLRALRLHGREVKDMLRLGIPAGLQGTVFNLSNVLIQSTVNSFGSLVMAGNTAAQNLEGFVYTSMNAMHQTATTFAAQNYGAGKTERLPKVLWQCEGIVLVIGVVLGGAFTLLGHPLLSIYTDSEVAIHFGILRLSCICAPYFLCGCMDVISGQLRGVGCSVAPMINSLICACALRIVWIYTLVNPLRESLGEEGALRLLYISYPVSWILATSVHFVIYAVISRKWKNKKEVRI